MAGPFPGVDPYVEGQSYWPDFHLKFLNYWQEAIAEQLPDDYEARLDERVNLVDVEAGASQRIKPDIAVVHHPNQRATPAGGALLLEPETIPTIILDEDRQAFIKILHRPDRTLVAVLELLSPANKTDPGRREYLARRNAILWQPIHLVELDLLIAGQRLPMQRPLPPGDFFALVARAERRPDCEVYAWSVRQPLPLVPVPLRASDPDIPIDLSEVYATAFERGRYARSIDYDAPLNLPMAAEDLGWAEQQARAFRA